MSTAGLVPRGTFILPFAMPQKVFITSSPSTERQTARNRMSSSHIRTSMRRFAHSLLLAPKAWQFLLMMLWDVPGVRFSRSCMVTGSPWSECSFNKILACWTSILGLFVTLRRYSSAFSRFEDFMMFSFWLSLWGLFSPWLVKTHPLQALIQSGLVGWADLQSRLRLAAWLWVA